MIDNGSTALPYEVEGWWHNVEQPADMLRANALLLARRTRETDEADDSIIQLANGAEVIGTKLSGPIAIGAKTQVVNSEIGPNVAIGVNCTLRGCKLKNAIVLDNVTLDGPIVGEAAHVAVSGPEATITGTIGDGTIQRIGLADATQT